MIIQKLPKLFQTNPLVARLASLFEGQKVLYSSIVYLSGGKKFIINKNEDTPYFQKDWQCYSFLRCYANTLITTGSILRAEKDTYKSYFACGDKEIEEMYENFRKNQKQNVYVMTHSMKKDEVLTYFNPALYNVLLSDFVNQKSIQKIPFSQILRTLVKSNKSPVLIECGPMVMKQYFLQIQQNKTQNLIDGVYIAFFEGYLPNSCIGNELLFEQDLFEQIWESQKFQIQHKGQKIGSVYFKVYHNEKFRGQN